MPRILLLISLLAGGLYSQAPQFTPAQQPNTVNIRSRTIGQQPGVPEVKAAADRSRVPLGEQVMFTLTPASVIKDPCYQVTLFFGDGSRQIARQAQIVHTYGASGNYTYSILVQSTGKCTSTPTPTPLTDIPNVRLIVTPSSVAVNQSVTFVAELSRPVPNYSYRFVFGDGSETGWQDDPRAVHAYREPRSYQPYVDIGYSVRGAIKQVGGSKRQTITVSGNQSANTNSNGNRNDNRANTNGNRNTRPNNNQSSSTNRNANTSGNLNARGSVNRNANANATPQASATVSVSPTANQHYSPNDWWPYLVFLPLLVLAAYKAIEYFLVPRPTFVPNPAVGKAKASGFGFDIQLDVDPEVDGAFKIDTEGGSLIKGTRKER